MQVLFPQIIAFEKKNIIYIQFFILPLDSSNSEIILEYYVISLRFRTFSNDIISSQIESENIYYWYCVK